MEAPTETLLISQNTGTEAIQARRGRPFAKSKLGKEQANSSTAARIAAIFTRKEVIPSFIRYENG